MALPAWGNLILKKRDGSKAPPFSLSEPKYLLGRQEYCDIRINVPLVSREHAELCVDDNDKAWLVNLSQSNPAKMNGQVVTGKVCLKNNAEIDIGGRMFTFEKPELKPKTPEAAPRSANKRTPLGKVNERLSAGGGFKVTKAKTPESGKGFYNTPTKSLSVAAIKEAMSQKPAKTASPAAAASPANPLGMLMEYESIENSIVDGNVSMHSNSSVNEEAEQAPKRRSSVGSAKSPKVATPKATTPKAATPAQRRALPTPLRNAIAAVKPATPKVATPKAKTPVKAATPKSRILPSDLKSDIEKRRRRSSVGGEEVEEVVRPKALPTPLRSAIQAKRKSLSADVVEVAVTAPTPIKEPTSKRRKSVVINTDENEIAHINEHRTHVIRTPRKTPMKKRSSISPAAKKSPKTKSPKSKSPSVGGRKSMDVVEGKDFVFEAPTTHKSGSPVVSSKTSTPKAATPTYGKIASASRKSADRQSLNQSLEGMAEMFATPKAKTPVKSVTPKSSRKSVDHMEDGFLEQIFTATPKAKTPAKAATPKATTPAQRRALPTPLRNAIAAVKPATPKVATPKAKTPVKAVTPKSSRKSVDHMEDGFLEQIFTATPKAKTPAKAATPKATTPAQRRALPTPLRNAIAAVKPATPKVATPKAKTPVKAVTPKSSRKSMSGRPSLDTVEGMATLFGTPAGCLTPAQVAVMEETYENAMEFLFQTTKDEASDAQLRTIDACLEKALDVAEAAVVEPVETPKSTGKRKSVEQSKTPVKAVTPKAKTPVKAVTPKAKTPVKAVTPKAKTPVKAVTPKAKTPVKEAAEEEMVEPSPPKAKRTRRSLAAAPVAAEADAPVRRATRKSMAPCMPTATIPKPSYKEVETLDDKFFMSHTVVQLKSMLTDKGLETTGKKADLVARLLANAGVAAVEEAAPAPASRRGRKSVEPAPVVEAAVEAEQVMDEKFFMSHTVVQLKSMLTDKGLETTGKKADLVARLLEAVAPAPVAEKKKSNKRKSILPDNMDLCIIPEDEEMESARPKRASRKSVAPAPVADKVVAKAKAAKKAIAKKATAAAPVRTTRSRRA